MARIFTLLLLLLDVLFASAQIDSLCDGSLGNNIFLNGSLGRGNTLTVEQDPMIAPGYQYLSYLPNDGQYTITQNIIDLHPPDTWINVIDAGGDSLGYFLVFNASYDPSIFYEQRVVGLCPNTLYEFSVEVVNLIARDVEFHIDPNLTFFLDTLEVYSTGTIPRSEHWEKYGLSFSTGPNQTSVTLSVRNNAPGGAGNDLAMDNISFRPCVPGTRITSSDADMQYTCPRDTNIVISATVPSGWNIRWQYSTDSINWVDYLNDVTIFQFDQLELGDHFYRYLVVKEIANFSNEKCVAISDVVQVNVVQKVLVQFDTICFGMTRQFGDSIIITSGIYFDTLQNADQSICDSIVELHLFVLNDANINIDPMIAQPNCFGENGAISSIVLNGRYPPLSYEVYDDSGKKRIKDELASGNYNIKASDVFGCMDSLAFEIISPEVFTLEIGNDTTIFSGDVVDLLATSDQNIATLEWGPDYKLSCTDCLNPQASPTMTIKYSVTAFSETGCSLTVQKTITVIKQSAGAFIPNIIALFSKDDNDVFSITLPEDSNASLSMLEIYDRYGNVVFHSTDEFSWNGQFNGGPVETGVYTYLIEFIFDNGEKELKVGDLTLVK